MVALSMDQPDLPICVCLTPFKITLYGYALVHSEHHLQLVCVLSLTNLPWNSAVISFLYNTAPS